MLRDLGQDLRNINISDAHLPRINLSRQNLTGIIGHGASLYDANLGGAYLSQVELFDAVLNGVNFSNAKNIPDLSRACYYGLGPCVPEGFPKGRLPQLSRSGLTCVYKQR